MTELTELERLKKAGVDAEATYDASVATADMLNAAVPYADGIESAAAYAADLAADNAGRAYAVWVKARLELSEYLKEHGDEHSI